MANVIGQFIVTFMALLAIIIATFNMSSEFNECLVKFPEDRLAFGINTGLWVGAIGSGLLFITLIVKRTEMGNEQKVCLGLAIGATWGAMTKGKSYWNLVVASLIFHPVITEKLVTMIALLFNIISGVACLHGYKMHPKQVIKYAVILPGLFLLVGAFYWVTSASFIFGIIVFAPACLFISVFLMPLYYLFEATKGCANSLASKEIEIPGYGKLIEAGTLWWAKKEFEPRSVWTAIGICFFLLIASPAFVLGSWAAFYCYLNGEAKVMSQIFHFKKLSYR